MSSEVTRIADMLGGERTLERQVRNLGDLRAAVEQGLPSGALASVTRHVSRNLREAKKLEQRVVPKSTLSRRKGRNLGRATSERLARLARLVVLAEEVWEDRDLAREFLESPQPRLGGAAPLDLLDTELGAREVEELLHHLEHALPA